MNEVFQVGLVTGLVGHGPKVFFDGFSTTMTDIIKGFNPYMCPAKAKHVDNWNTLQFYAY